jgi:hypothetical protein
MRILRIFSCAAFWFFQRFRGLQPENAYFGPFADTHIFPRRGRAPAA